MNNKINLALLIGVGKRQDDEQAMAITATDAEKLASELEKRCDVELENIHCLTNEKATKTHILNKLQQLVNDSEGIPIDTLWIYFSGHGYQQIINNAKEYYLICNDTVKANITDTSIAGNDFVNGINQINASKVIVLLDCCHAGGISTMHKSNIPFDSDQLLEKQNRVIISASHAEQVAFISQPVSLFTYALIEGIAGNYFQEGDKHVSLFDLAMYIRERVYPLSKRKQQPKLNVFENSKTENFSILCYPHGKPLTPAFDTQFILCDGHGKTLDTRGEIEKDMAYRNQYLWLQKNINSGNIHAERDVIIGDNTSMTNQQHFGSGDNVAGDKNIHNTNIAKIDGDNNVSIQGLNSDKDINITITKR